MIGNEEDDRRLSYGIIAAPAASSTVGAVGIGYKTSDSGTLARSFTQRPASISPLERFLSPSASSQEGRRSTTVGDKNECDREGSGITPSAAESRASSPTVSTRSSGASSAETQLDRGRGGDRKYGSRSGEYDETTDGNSTDGSSGSDVDSVNRLRGHSATSSVTTVCEGGDASQEESLPVCPVPSLGVEDSVGRHTQED